MNVIVNILSEQQTLDLLDLFKEDFEIISDNLADVLYTFYLEMPLELTLILIVSIILLLTTLIFFIRNFGRIKKKFIAVRKHFG